MINKKLRNKDLCKIRTITSFLSLTKDKSKWSDKIKNASIFGGDLSKEFIKNGYEVQSIRIVTNAFGEYIDTSSLQSAIADIQILNDILNDPSMPNIRIRFAIGEAKTTNEINMIAQLIKKFEDLCNICVNIEVDDLGIPNKAKTTLCAKVVKEIASITPKAQGNFNFTVNYNCKPLIPYFPASYHNSSDEDCFALGLQTPDLLVEALQLVEDDNHNIKWKNSYDIMSSALQYHVNNVLKITNNFTHKNKTKFAGIDTSAAPSKNCSSLVDVYKLLDVKYFGSSGTIEASALLTKVFKSIKGCELIGFSGLMLALIEDEGLSDASKKDLFDIRSLLTYSSVCGIGLDTVPIEGDTSIEKISNIMSDTGTMAFRLNKPLTVRLFPVPNLKKGDITDFVSDDLCNSAILFVP